jgi:ketosteroid isomerase-like protein
MSEENVEIVRRSYERVNDGLEILPLEFFDPDYEFDAREVAPSFGVIRGYAAVQAALLEYWQTFEDFSLELKDVVHADGERVVTAVRDGGRMKGSDAEIWNDLFHVWTFRHGKVLRLSSHNEKKRALEAAGLSE